MAGEEHRLRPYRGSLPTRLRGLPAGQPAADVIRVEFQVFADALERERLASRISAARRAVLRKGRVLFITVTPYLTIEGFTSAKPEPNKSQVLHSRGA